MTHSYTYIRMTHSYTWLAHIHTYTDSLTYIHIYDSLIYMTHSFTWLAHIHEITLRYDMNHSLTWHDLLIPDSATHCNALRHAATHCNTLQHKRVTRRRCKCVIFSCQIHIHDTIFTRNLKSLYKTRSGDRRFVDSAGTNASSRINACVLILKLFPLTSVLKRRIRVPLYCYRIDISNRYSCDSVGRIDLNPTSPN